MENWDDGGGVGERGKEGKGGEGGREGGKDGEQGGDGWRRQLVGASRLFPELFSFICCFLFVFIFDFILFSAVVSICCQFSGPPDSCFLC